jgi:hydrogenase maturation protease
MSGSDSAVVVLGYGNSDRRDDGLGPRFAGTIEDLHIEGVTAEIKSQITVEHASLIALHDAVIFVDATFDGPEPFRFERIRPDFTLAFRSHRIEPAAVLALARGLFGAQTEGYVLGIRGYAFRHLGEGLSAKARKNLEAALELVVPVLRRIPLRKEPAETSSRRRAIHSAA